MLTGSNGNFTSNSHFRLLGAVLEVLHVQPTLAAVCPPPASPCVIRGAVIKVELVSIP